MFKAKTTIRFLPILIGLMFQLSCSGAESGPVTLPVPFSGTLALNSTVCAANGSSNHTGALQGHASGDQWECFGPKGDSRGVISFDLSTKNECVELASDRCTFTMDVSIDLNDGISGVSGNIQFFDFPHEIAPRNTPPPGANISIRKGIASGTIRRCEGAFASYCNLTIDCRYVFENVRHNDGVETFLDHRVNVCVIGSERSDPL
jgi:hypothetical protein